MNPQDWEGAAFDPNAGRHFSILPDEDADEAYCVRHDREMKQVDPILHHDGGLYTTTETFSVYTCPRCLEDINRKVNHPRGGLMAYQKALMDVFDRWDDGGAEGDWFRYLRDGTAEDVTGGDLRD